MPLSLRSPLLLLFCGVAFARCANVKEVNTFAVTSQQVLDRQRTETFGYYSYYHDSAYLYHYLPDHLRDVDCPCDAEKQADANVGREYALLSAYFATLARFADRTAVINFAPVGAPLPAGAYGHVTITAQEASYASYVATALTTLTTTRYKTKKIPVLMARYRDSVAPLITLLKIRADNLGGRMVNLELQLDRLTDSLLNAVPDKSVRMPVLFEYEQKRKELDATLTHYRQRVHDLETITAGGQLILDNLDNLHSKALKDKLTGLVDALLLNYH